MSFGLQPAEGGGRRLAIVLPVKPFTLAKTRLAPLLDDEVRAGFARAMFLDVLTTVCKARSARDVFVVSACDEAAAFARQVNAQVVVEPATAGMAAALTLATARLRPAGYDSMLVLPTDVPLMTGNDVQAIAAALGEAADVVLVPATESGGTNALACGPLDAIPCCFGEGSFRKHRDGAAAAGLTARVLRLERVGLDIDCPSDIAAFLAYSASSRSRAYLRGVGIDGRFGAEQAASFDGFGASRSVGRGGGNVT